MLDTSNETWKTINGFDQYQVSDHGRVRSLKHRSPRVLSRNWNVDNKAQVQLKIDGKNRVRSVAKLMLEHFVGDCPPGMYSTPIDGNNENLMLSNWKWGNY